MIKEKLLNSDKENLKYILSIATEKIIITVTITKYKWTRIKIL